MILLTIKIPKILVLTLKATNGQDADDPSDPTYQPILQIGEIATFTYVVTNDGNVDLTNVVVLDDNGTVGDTSDDFEPNLIDQGNGDNTLAVGETWTYEGIRVVTAGQYTNIGTVTATPVPSELPEVTDSDASNHFGENNNDGGQGLTIGALKQYYKNRNKGGKNAEKYDATWVASEYDPSDLYAGALLLSSEDDLLNTLGETTYDEIAGFDGEAGISLIDALNAQGNDDNFENFLRQSTAGFLNAANPDISYEYGVSEVRGFAQSVFEIPAPLSASEINALATDLDNFNNAGNVELW